MAKFLTYFENSAGQIQWPPFEDCPTPRGFERRECNSLSEVDRIYKRLQLDQKVVMEIAAQRDANSAWAQHSQRIREDLIARMHSASISPYERDFIRDWLCVRDEEKKKYFRQAYEQRELVLEAREMDHARTPDEILGESL